MAYDSQLVDALREVARLTHELAEQKECECAIIESVASWAKRAEHAEADLLVCQQARSYQEEFGNKCLRDVLQLRADITAMREGIAQVIEAMGTEAGDACSIFNGSFSARYETCSCYIHQHRTRKWAETLSRLIARDRG